MKRKTLFLTFSVLLALASCAGGHDGSHGGGNSDSSVISDGIIRHTVNFYLDGEIVKTLNVQDGQKMNAPSSEELPKGYVIDHWYVLEGALKSPWSFSGGTVTSDLDLYADFQYETYTVNVIDVYGESHKTTSSYKQAYDFSSFFDGPALERLDYLEGEAGERLAVKGTWLLTSDMTLTPVFAEWDIAYEFYELASPLTQYTKVLLMSEKLDGVSNQNPSSLFGKPDDLNASLIDASKDGYRFEGWFKLITIDDGYSESNPGLWAGSFSKLENIKEGYLGKTVYGLFSKYNSISIASNNDEFGRVDFVNGAIASACYGDSIAVTATPNNGYVLKGWYSEDTFVSNDNSYTFEMPAKDYSLTAVFCGKAEAERLGVLPVLDEAKGTITYGLYPQTHVSDAATVAALDSLTATENNGWYLYDGVYYAKETAKPYGTSYVFDDGTKIVSGTSYWFRCEPIEWKALASDDGSYSLVSAALLDAHRYNEYYSGAKDGYYANNYANSEIRGWLNGGFYSSAFALGDSHIQTTTVDNSGATTGWLSNRYACENTEDKVYLLSYRDYMNGSYFADDAARRCKTTDYARARGAWYSTDTSYLYNGYYWTRSPGYDDSYCAWSVDYVGDLYYGSVHNSNLAVRPALSINL